MVHFDISYQIIAEISNYSPLQLRGNVNCLVCCCSAVDVHWKRRSADCIHSSHRTRPCVLIIYLLTNVDLPSRRLDIVKTRPAIYRQSLLFSQLYIGSFYFWNLLSGKLRRPRRRTTALLGIYIVPYIEGSSETSPEINECLGLAEF